jgi:hypothetical protein
MGTTSIALRKFSKIEAKSRASRPTASAASEALKVPSRARSLLEFLSQAVERHFAVITSVYLPALE